MDDPNKKDQTAEQPTHEKSPIPAWGSPEDVNAIMTLRQEHAAMLIAENLLLTRTNQSLQEKCDILLGRVQMLERENDRLSTITKVAPSARSEGSAEPVDEHSLAQRLVGIIAEGACLDKDGLVTTQTMKRLIKTELKKMFSHMGD